MYTWRTHNLYSSFVHSLIHSLMHLFIHSFIHSIHTFNSFQFNSFHFSSFHFVSSHFIHFIYSFHVITCQFSSLHITLLKFISIYFITFHFITVYFIPHHITSCHFISHHFLSFLSCHFTLFHLSFTHSSTHSYIIVHLTSVHIQPLNINVCFCCLFKAPTRAVPNAKREWRLHLPAHLAVVQTLPPEKSPLVTVLVPPRVDGFLTRKTLNKHSFARFPGEPVYLQDYYLHLTYI